MVYCRLVTRGKLGYIIFMVMERAKLFTGLYICIQSAFFTFGHLILKTM